MTSLCTYYNDHIITYLAFSHLVTLTLGVIIVLSGLHSFADLHANDVNLGLAVLQHLQCRLEHLFILIGEQRRQKGNENSGRRNSESLGTIKNTVFSSLTDIGATFAMQILST